MLKKWTGRTAAVTIALIIGWMILRPWVGASNDDAKRVERDTEPVPTIEILKPLATTSRSVIVDSTPQPSLMRDLNTSTNYREFIAKAKNNVGIGGAAYAMFAMHECDNILAVLKTLTQYPRPAATDSKNIVARAEAKILLESRCGVLMQQETDVLAYRKTLKASGLLETDPLLNISSRLFSPSYKTDPTSRREFVSAILDSQDPLLWDQYGGILVNVDYDHRRVYFDGTMHDIDKVPELVMARTLVTCGLGRDCDAQHDLNVAQICVQLTICEHDRFALTKLQADAQGLDFVKVMTFYDQMVAAFRARRIEAFVQT